MIHQQAKASISAKKTKAIKRLKIVSSFNRRDDRGNRVNDPRAMILDVVPVIPLNSGRWFNLMVEDLQHLTLMTFTEEL
ncbi:MAG: hypothetical protein CM15mP49_18930 [Actinomycetota bacterium]|nr:MAG: hypothetical protein CM15mP49_18930 [Actinomycetota bacterium]